LEQMFVPEYAGAKDHRLLPALFADVQYANGFFVSTARGIGVSKKSITVILVLH